jgi:hypothetical protein
MSRYKEKCNVTSCKKPHDGISHYFTKHKYCYWCARKINAANRGYEDFPIFDLDDIKSGLEILRERDGG